MFLIVESGSTKADWVEVYPKGETRFHKTSGINPTTQANLLDLKQNQLLLTALNQCSKIFFYGAGVSNDHSKQRIKEWLQQDTNDAVIFVESDMLAAAKACCGDQSGLIGILGTGSNSCVYDGQNRVDVIPSLGYILGDEGSGAHIGKEILRAHFCRVMPEPIEKAFNKRFQLTRDDILDNVYTKKAGSSYIASFASFLADVDEDWKQTILNKVFKEFIEFRILTLKNPNNYPIHFVGSIAFLYQDILKNVMNEYGLSVTNIIQQPIHSLINYHYKKEY